VRKYRRPLFSDNYFFFDARPETPSVRTVCSRRTPYRSQLNWFTQTVKATDDWRSCKPSPRPWPTATECVHLAGEAKVRRRGPYERDLVRADTRFTRSIAASIHARALAYASRWGAVELPTTSCVVTSAVAVVRVDNVEKACHQGMMRSVNCGGGITPLARDGVDGFDLVGTHLIESLVRQRDNLVLRIPGSMLEDVLVDTVDHCRRWESSISSSGF